MSRSTVIIIAATCVAIVSIIAIVLIGDFNGHDTGILIAAITGFATPTFVALITLAQSVINGEKTQRVEEGLASVNNKVNGHLATLTSIVVGHAASGQPISPVVANQLATRTSQLTGLTVDRVPMVEEPATNKKNEETRGNP